MIVSDFFSIIPIFGWDYIIWGNIGIIEKNMETTIMGYIVVITAIWGRGSMGVGSMGTPEMMNKLCNL